MKEFAIWNPIDLGYAAIYAAHEFVKGKANAKAGGSVRVGRVGKVTLDANGEAAMARRSPTTRATSTNSPRFLAMPRSLEALLRARVC